MAAVENILASNTAPRKDVARAPSKVPFAPILASQIEARISDLAAPRAAQPANNDRFEARRDNPNDDKIRHDDRHGARDDAARADRTRADDPKHKDAPVDNREIKNIAPREADERHLTRSEPRPERAEPAPSTEAAASRSASKHESADASKSSASDTTSSETAISSENVASTKTVGASETSPAAPVPTGTASEPTATAAVDLSASPDAVAMLGEIGTASNGAKAMPNNAAPSGATGSAPVNASGSPSDAPIAPMAGDPASAPKPDGKINITGMTPSNDDTPSKIGSEVPQIVRDDQSIVARPANAAGGNLMQAQQQGDVTTGQNLNTPAKSGNATPLAHNAGQGAPLHVGGDASGNANQNAGQNGGQSANNPNGQGANGQGTNGQGTGAQAGPGQTGIAGAQPTGLPGEISTTQQAAQSFQSNLARASGPVGAGGPGAISGDGAIMARGDGTITGTGASQGTLTSDPASRAAQASTSHPGRNAPATDQVSVSLKKAVENGDSKLRIQLRPHELGRVEVKLDIAGDGRAKAMVLAERPETLELLQRDSRVLERALQDAGLKTDHNSLSFDLQGRDGEDRAQHAQREDAEDKGTSTENADDGDVIDNTEQPIPATAIGLAPDGSVNFLA